VRTQAQNGKCAADPGVGDRHPASLTHHTWCTECGVRGGTARHCRTDAPDGAGAQVERLPRSAVGGSKPATGHGLPRPPRLASILVCGPAIKSASRPADSLRSPLTAGPQTKNRPAIGEAPEKWSAVPRPSSSEGGSGSTPSRRTGCNGCDGSGCLRVDVVVRPLHRRPRLSQRPPCAYRVDDFRITLCVWSKKRFAASR
jgi:hypothetical protein